MTHPSESIAALPVPVSRATSRHDVRAWVALVLWAVVPMLALFGLYRLDGLVDRNVVRVFATLTGFVLVALVARRTSILQARALDAREHAKGSPLRRRATLAAPRRWALWLATCSVALAAGYVVLARDAHHSSNLLPTSPLDIAVLLVGAAIVTPYLLDLASGAITRRVPFSTRGPSRGFVPEPNVVGGLARMSPMLLFFVVLALMEYAATWILGIHHLLKLLGGFGFVAMTAAGVLAAPTIIISVSDDIEPVWRSRWYRKQLDAADRLRRALGFVRRLLRTVQVTSAGLLLGAPSALTSRQIGVLSLAFVFTVLTAHALTRILWVWAPKDPQAAPITVDVLKQHEQAMLRTAAVALTAGSIMSLAAILLA
jgi:hypothetical protein